MSIIRCCFDKPELPEFLDSFVQKCTVPPCCCGCCSALRPRYKRLVDNVFPVNADDGLVKSNMEKLTFYSVSSPEKLDRIGEYLYQKASKDINRKRYKLVEIAMEAMDLLLVACHAQTLNLFVESFLRMVQKLLEDSNATLQILATNSFVKFANIEEDTPSYHRRYDFFISKFSSMCHSSHDDRALCTQLRMAGIRGLQGVIRKTVSDDLVENIWDRQHMEKIVPSLLYNMQTAETMAPAAGSPSTLALAANEATATDAKTTAASATNGSGTTSSGSSSLYSSAIAVPLNSSSVGGEDSSATATPPALAESVLRELVSRASFTHIKSVLSPLLQHLDRHELWVPNQFAIHTFRIVMISIQPQYSYTVVETLMQHLDQNMKSSPRTKTSLAVVLSKIIAIAAGESVGPSALDIINNLLTHLRTSTLLAAAAAAGTTEEEDHYQEALINALGEFANHHPDYQKIEIMLFIMNTVPDMAKSGPADLRLQLILLRSLRRVSVQYRTIHFEKAFPASFRQPLLRMARAPHVEIRMIVMQILQALLDRHDNQADVLQVVGRMAEVGRGGGGGALTGGGGLGLTNGGVAVAASAAAVLAELSLESPSRSDIMFARKHGAVMMQALIDAMALDDTRDGMRATWRTTALLVVELGCGETIQEFLLFVLGIEKLAITMPADTIGYAHRCNLHTVAITLLGLLGHVTGVNNLREYCAKLMDARAADAPHWLHADLLDPATQLAGDPDRRPLNQPHLYIDQLALVECLQNADMESGRLAAGTPYTLHQADMAGHRHSWVGDTTSVSVSGGGGGVQRSGRTSLDDITGASFNGSTSAATSGGADLDSSVNSSPVLPRRQAITVELNFDAMKRALAEPTEAAKREAREKSVQLTRVFREASFDELVRRTEPKHEMLQNRLNDLFTALAVERQIQAQSELKSAAVAASAAGVQPLLAAAMAGVSVGGGGSAAAAVAIGRERPIYEQSFPELFYY